MKYKISTTSCEEKPCDKAYESEYIYEHIRTISEFEFDTRFSHREGEWRSKGYSHSIPKENHICRLESRPAWVINIDSLEDLNDLSKKHGELIISFKENGGTPTIEIYDDYRE